MKWFLSRESFSHLLFAERKKSQDRKATPSLGGMVFGERGVKGSWIM